MIVTQAVLKHLFDYDPETGKLFWKNCPRDFRNGSEAGCRHRDGYKVTGVAGKQYKVHRLIWMWVHGVWPINIDHINRVKDDNRLCNLRAATRQQNNANRPIGRKKSGLPHGVQRVSYSKTFRAAIKVDRKTIHLGSFATVEEAREAYCKAARHHFGEFALVA